MLLILRGLPLGNEAIKAYIGAWTSLLKRTAPSNERAVQQILFDHLYSNLNVLDSKTGSLIQLNGILMAAYTIVIGPYDDRLTLHTNARDLFFVGVAYATWALFRCLSVIWVHWSSTDNLRDPEQHMEKLILVRNARTIVYRRAWTFSILSLVALASLLLESLVFSTDFHVRTPLVAIVITHLFLIYPYDRVVGLACYWFRRYRVRC